jgi:lysophospholipase L1-like esterase
MSKLPIPRRELVQAVLAFALLIAGAEFVVGRWLQTPSTAVFDPRFGLVQRPHSRFVQSLEGWTEARANSDGLFDTELRTPRPRTRVLLLGDSFSEAVQVRPEEGFARVVERLDPEVEVVNAGLSGRFPAHYAAYHRVYLDRYRPDLLLVQVNDGDVTELGDPAKLAQVGAETGPMHVPPVSVASASGSVVDVLRSFFRRSALAKLIQIRLRQLAGFERRRFRAKFSGAPPEADDSALPATSRSWAVADSLFADLAASEVPMILLYIPHMNYVDAAPHEAYPSRRDFWRRFAARHRLPLVDPTDAFVREFRRSGLPLHGFPNTRFATGHINARGHAVIAAELAAALRGFRP